MDKLVKLVRVKSMVEMNFISDQHEYTITQVCHGILNNYNKIKSIMEDDDNIFTKR